MLRIVRLAFLALICAPFVVLVAPILFWLGRPMASSSYESVTCEDGVDVDDPGVDVDE